MSILGCQIWHSAPRLIDFPGQLPWRRFMKAVVEFEKAQRMPAEVTELELELGWRRSPTEKLESTLLKPSIKLRIFLCSRQWICCHKRLWRQVHRRFRQIHGQEIHKSMLYGTHRDISLNIIAAALVDPEESQLNGMGSGQVCMTFLKNISFCYCWG